MKFPILTEDEKAMILGDFLPKTGRAPSRESSCRSCGRPCPQPSVQDPEAPRSSSCRNPEPAPEDPNAAIEMLKARYRATRSIRDLLAWSDAVGAEARRMAAAAARIILRVNTRAIARRFEGMPG